MREQYEVGLQVPLEIRSRTMRIETLSERIANAENRIGKKQRTILLQL